MKKIIGCMLLVFFVFSGICLAEPASTNDLWDVSQGSKVTDTSGIMNPGGGFWASYADNMFGAVHPGTAEAYNTLFPDGKAAGYTHWIEWQTPSEIALKSFNLVAGHDGDSKYSKGSIFKRGFSEFELFAWDGSGWTSVYDFMTDSDGDGLYGGGPSYPAKTALELTVNLGSPMIAQRFRAEFTQAGDSINGGPRILELDGYGYYLGDDEGGSSVPEPTTVLLLAMGLLVLGVVRHRVLQTA